MCIRDRLVILESNGRIRDNRAPGALPWNRAEIVAVLGDGSLLAQGEQRLIAYSTASIGTLAGTTPVRLGRLFPNGSWQTLVAGEPEYFSAANGWLDADGRVVVHVPGDATTSESPNRSDLWRFFSDGSRDTTYRAVDERGAAIALGTAAPSDDGRGAWATSRANKLLRLDSSGRLTKTLPPRVTGGIATIAATPGGAVIGGSFQRINEIPRPGFARVLDDGGLFAFTAETHEGRGVLLRETLRYAHGEDHVRTALVDAGLTVVSLTAASSRREKSIPVPGLVVVAVKPASTRPASGTTSNA